MCHDTGETKCFPESAIRWFRRVWLQRGIHSRHTCARCAARVFPRHMLVLLRDDGHWLQNSEDNWEGRMSAIRQPILRAEKSIKSNQIKIKHVEESQGVITSKLSDVETKISSVETKISSVEQSQQCMSKQMADILKLMQNLNEPRATAHAQLGVAENVEARRAEPEPAAGPNAASPSYSQQDTKTLVSAAARRRTVPESPSFSHARSAGSHTSVALTF